MIPLHLRPFGHVLALMQAVVPYHQTIQVQGVELATIPLFRNKHLSGLVARQYVELIASFCGFEIKNEKQYNTVSVLLANVFLTQFVDLGFYNTAIAVPFKTQDWINAKPLLDLDLATMIHLRETLFTKKKINRIMGFKGIEFGRRTLIVPNKELFCLFEGGEGGGAEALPLRENRFFTSLTTSENTPKLENFRDSSHEGNAYMFIEDNLKGLSYVKNRTTGLPASIDVAYTETLGKLNLARPECTLGARRLGTGLTHIQHALPDGKTGGRVYAEWQSTPRDKRSFLVLNGIPTTEIDIVASHVWQAYNLAGEVMPRDPYVLPELGSEQNLFRPVVKHAMMVMLNANSEASALQAIALEHRTQACIELKTLLKPHGGPIDDAGRVTPGWGIKAQQDLNKAFLARDAQSALAVVRNCGPKTYEAILAGARWCVVSAKDIMGHVMRAHRPIHGMFCSDFGLRAMAVEGATCIHTLTILLQDNQRLPAMPLHDGFVCEADRIQDVVNAWSAAYHGVTVEIPRFVNKTTGKEIIANDIH